MYRSLSALALATALVVACYGQAPPKTKTAKLPFGWSKIGLSEEVKKKALAIVSKANAEIHELESKIAEIRAKERADLNALLTDAQRAELRKYLESKGGLDAAKEPTPPPKSAEKP